MKKNLLIIDGLNYFFRAYYGITDAIKTKNGISVNAVYGFFAFLRKAVTSISSSHLIIIFDSEKAVQNKQLEFVNYKQNRKYEEGMFAQLRIIKGILQIMDIKFLEENYIEADDLIGAYCKYGNKSNCTVYISSNDFDFMQLISKEIFVLRNFKGEQLIFDEEKVRKTFGVDPSSYVDYASLLGDKSDNIEGVRGIGKITAKNLINKYGSVENLINNIDHIQENAIKNKIKNSIKKLVLNKKIITINQGITNDFLPIDCLLFDKEKLNKKTSNYLMELNF